MTKDKKGSKLDEHIRAYRIATSCAGLVHLLFIVFFTISKMYPLAVFNAFSVLIYLYVFLRVNTKNTMRYSAYIFFEVCVHSVLSAMFAGWECGFQLYVVALIPISFLVMYNHLNKLIMPCMYSAVAVIVFVGVKIMYFLTGDEVNFFSKNTSFILYIVNAILMGFMLVVSSLYFFFELEKQREKIAKKNAQLDYLANVDPLTGLFNRRRMMEILNEIDKSNGYNSILMGDIDDFKRINDTYGHGFGDITLKYVADIFKKIVAEDGAVCRWGGEEFLILLKNKNINEAVVIAEKIRKEIESNSNIAESEKINITVTIGAAQYNFNDTFDEIIRTADERLYKGKKGGKNVVIDS